MPNELENLLNELDGPMGGVDLGGLQEPAPQAVQQTPEPAPAPAPVAPQAPAQAPAQVHTPQGQMNFDMAQARLQAAQAQPQNQAPVAPQEQPADLRAFRDDEIVLTEDQKKALENGGVGELIARAARKELNEGLIRQGKRYLDEINKLKADNEQLKQSMNQSRATNFQAELSRLVPDFQEILANPEFQAFANQTTFDANYAGPVARYTLLNNAYNAQNINYIVHVVKEWRSSQAPAQPAAPQNNEPRPVRATPGQGFQATPAAAPLSQAGAEQRLRQQWATYNQKLDAASKSGELKKPENYAKYDKTLKALSAEAQRLGIRLT